MWRAEPVMGPAPSIVIDELRIVYPNGTVALEGVTLRLDEPTICGLVGMNGSGKSSLFKAVMGLVAPAGGTVTIDGGPPRRAQRAGAVAYVPQGEEVDWTFPVLVEEVVMMGRQGRMGLLRIPSAEDRRIVAQSLERVGITGLARRQIGELSGGQRKRVFIARALAQEARIVLLDEPFTGVDVTTEEAITAILRELRDAGRTIMISTHNLASVPDTCDLVALVDRRLVAFGPTGETFTAANLALTFGGSLQRLPAGVFAAIGVDAERGDRARPRALVTAA